MPCSKGMTRCVPSCLHRARVRTYQDGRDAQLDRMASATGQEDPYSEEGRAFFRDPSVPPFDPNEKKLVFRDHLVETANPAAPSDRSHSCSEALCSCPVHGTIMYYSPGGDEHACREVDCRYGHGYEVVRDQELMEEFGGAGSRTEVL